MRDYMVRVTRHPLEPERREQLRAAGRLPDDYLRRSVEATDFVKVEAENDRQAMTGARMQTDLVFKGELVSFHERMPNGTFREMR